MEFDTSDSDEQWSELETLDVLPHRTGHIAATVGSYMLVWGGYRDDDTYVGDHYLTPNDVWYYHTDLKKWNVKEVNGEGRPQGTSGAGVVVIDKYLYIVGGHSYFGNINDIHRLDLSTWTWEKLEHKGKAMSPRDKFSVWEFDKKIYVFGGFGVPIDGFLHDNGEFVEDSDGISVMWGMPRGWNNQLLIFDLVTRTWANPKCNGTLLLPRAAHTSVRMDRKVYTFGGRHKRRRINDMHCLDLDSLECSEISCRTPVPEGRSWHTWTKVSETCIFLFGGFNQQNQALSDTWLFDIQSHMWTRLTFPQAAPRLWHTTSFSNNGDITVFGGCCNNILSQEEVSLISNEVITFRCSPKSLLRTCLEQTVAFRHMNWQEWPSLPKTLYDGLNDLLYGDGKIRSLSSPETVVH